jgi:predicted HAD superfamily hydrolase
MTVGAIDSTIPGDDRLRELSELVARPSIRAVSTDVFDTLVWRAVPTPDEAFVLLGERLARRELLSPRLTVEAFAALRSAAELEARDRREVACENTEVTFEEIYRYMPEWIFDGIDAAGCAELELEVERDIVFCDPDVVALLTRAREHGKLVIAVSDTYLSADHLRSLLAAAGPEAPELDRVYTSCEHRTAKNDRLLRVVLDDLGLEPSQLLHFGDNPEADVDPAAALGIETRLFDRRPAPYPDLIEREHLLAPPRVPSERSLVARGALDAARTKALGRRSDPSVSPALEPYRAYGAAVLGPVFAGFAEWIHREAHRAGARRVHCLMREGAFLTELVNRVNEHLEGDVEAVPLWLNRRLCLRASITRLDRETLDTLVAHRSEPTVREVLDVLGLDASEVPSYSTQMDTSLGDPLIREGLIKRLTAEPHIEARVLAEARVLRERIAAMVGRQARDGEPLVIVDVGWGATIQRYLQATLEAAGLPSHTVGLYLVTAGRAASAAVHGAEIYGFLGDYGLPSATTDVVLRSPELIEQICMPDHGTQVGIDATLAPELLAAGTPEHQRVQAGAVRAGILQFQTEWARLRAAPGGAVAEPDATRDELRGILVRSVLDPTAAEVAAFGHWHHDGGRVDERTDPIADPAELQRIRYMVPDQLSEIPNPDLYWPFALAAQVDATWPALLRAGVSGRVPWEAMSSPLETGPFVVKATEGYDITPAVAEFTPSRNRFGLSLASASLQAAHIQQLTIWPAERPAVVRIDWIRMRCAVQGEPEPRVLTFGADGSFAPLARTNTIEIAPNTFALRGGLSSFVLDVGALTRRVVSRIDFECAFTAIAIGEVLPLDGDFVSVEHAASTVRNMQSSLSWRVTAPLRRGKRLRQRFR